MKYGYRCAALVAVAMLGLWAAGCGGGDETIVNNYEIPPLVEIKTPHLGDVLLGSALAETIDVAGGSGTYTFSIATGGTNDAWISIDPSTGDLTGTADTLGTVELYIHVEDAEDATKYDNAYYAFEVYAQAYPGTPVSDHNTADDGLAFSPSTVTYSSAGGLDLFFFTNHGNGTGIFLTHMEDANTSTYSLWASYFDGTSMTPMVEIKGELYDPTVDFSFGRIRVVFLNISGDPRDGDAVILFTRSEIDAGGVSDVRLYSSYFDASEAASAVSSSNADVRYGFDTAADLVNDDNDGSDVDVLGVMTDGFFVTSPSFSNGFEFFLNGSPVTYLAAVWTEFDGTGGKMYTANFDLTAANTDDSFSAASQVTTATTMDSDDQFGDRFSVAGRTIFYVVDLDNEPMLNHEILEAATWNSTTNVLFQNTQLSRIDADDEISASVPRNVFGAVQGLDRAYAVGEERGYDDDGGDEDTDAMLYIYDPADGSSEVQEIDNATGALASPMDVGYLNATLNRTGEILWIAWMQDYSDSNATRCLFAQAVQTVRSGGTARTLANSLLAAPLRMNADYQSTLDYADVIDWSSDRELQYLFGNSSDHLRANLIFLQEPDTAGDMDNLTLRTAYVKVTLDTTGTSPPTADTGSGYASDTAIWTNDENHPFWDSASVDIRHHFLCVDSGTSGQPLVYFTGDGDGTPEVESPTEASEVRLFLWDGRETTPAAVEISGDGTDTGVDTYGFSNSRQLVDPPDDRGMLQVTSVPITMYDGSNADVSASHHHVFFVEQRDVPGSTDALRHRCLDLAGTGTVQQNFSPALTSQPFDVDLGTPGDVVAFLGDGPSYSSGTTTAVYFKHGAHLWYNEYTPGASATWLTENGVSTPYLVDDDGSPEEVLGWNIFNIAPFTIGSWDLISHNPIIYLKLVNLVGSNNIRMYCTIHD